MINSHTDRPVHLVYGGVDVDDREEIRRLVEHEDKVLLSLIIAFSTGINIKRLHNLVFASPSKSESETYNPLVESSERTKGKGNSL